MNHYQGRAKMQHLQKIIKKGASRQSQAMEVKPEPLNPRATQAIQIRPNCPRSVSDVLIIFFVFFLRRFYISSFQTLDKAKRRRSNAKKPKGGES